MKNSHSFFKQYRRDQKHNLVSHDHIYDGINNQGKSLSKKNDSPLIKDEAFRLDRNSFVNKKIDYDFDYEYDYNYKYKYNHRKYYTNISEYKGSLLSEDKNHLISDNQNEKMINKKNTIINGIFNLKSSPIMLSFFEIIVYNKQKIWLLKNINFNYFHNKMNKDDYKTSMILSNEICQKVLSNT